MHALAGDSALDAVPIDLSEIRCRTTVLIMADGSRQHVLFQDDGRSLQLAVSGINVLASVQLLVDARLPARGRAARFAALDSFNDLLDASWLSGPHVPPDTGGRRLRIVLQALDGWLARAPYRDIAVALFGRTRVDDDWSDPRDHLRDQIRRAIRRGRTLMAGGYLNLLGSILLWTIFPDVF
jgi:hypothetical protein